MTDEELEVYVRALVAAPEVMALWGVCDRGVPVFVHSVDVLLLCLQRFPEWRARSPQIDLAAVAIGAMLHDSSKLSSHLLHGCSHSHLMSVDPDLAVDAARLVVDGLRTDLGLALEPGLREQVEHIVASHHGRFGKIHPQTPEAHLVHLCDLFSSTNHRVVPVDSNDILPLLDTGCRMQHVGALLGVGREVVKSRLADSCRAEHVRDWVELLAIWHREGRVAAGPPERSEQIRRVRQLIEVARGAPESLLNEIRAVSISLC